jgi:hypothetical protein
MRERMYGDLNSDVGNDDAQLDSAVLRYAYDRATRCVQSRQGPEAL